MTRLSSFLFVVACLLAACACDSSLEKGLPQPPPPPAPPPEALPLETVTMEDEDIVTLAENPDDASRSRLGYPCAWAAVWDDPKAAKPMPVGGMVKAPRKLVEVAPQLPPTKIAMDGTPVLEAVIGIDGGVTEAKILQSFDPPWPEGDAALLTAIKQWVYEPTKIEGTLIPVCTKIALQIDWDWSPRQ